MLVLGVGVAGLQAIATAKRLGAVIEASDVRPSVKDQVESLGGNGSTCRTTTDEERQIAEGAGGYARPMPPEWMAAAGRDHHRALQAVDIIITTALIPGRPAPKLDQGRHRCGDEAGHDHRRSRGRAGRQRRGLGGSAGSSSRTASSSSGSPTCRRWSPPTRARSMRATCSTFFALSLNAKTGEFAVPPTTRS